MLATHQLFVPIKQQAVTVLFLQNNPLKNVFFLSVEVVFRILVICGKKSKHVIIILGPMFFFKMVTYVPNELRKVTIIVVISVLGYNAHHMCRTRWQRAVHSFIYVHVKALCAGNTLCIRCQIATFFTIRKRMFCFSNVDFVMYM